MYNHREAARGTSIEPLRTRTYVLNDVYAYIGMYICMLEGLELGARGGGRMLGLELGVGGECWGWS